MSAGSSPDSAPIREMYRRFASGDTQGAFELLHPDAEFHQNPDFPGKRVHRGRDEFREGLAAFLTDWEDFRFDPLEIETGELIWMRVEIGGRGRTSGVPVDHEVFHVWELRDGAPYRCRVFLDEADSRRAAGFAA